MATNHKRPVTVNLDEEQIDWADDQPEGRSEAIRSAIEEYRERLEE